MLCHVSRLTPISRARRHDVSMANQGISLARENHFQTMSSILFFCAVCGQALTAEPALAGRVMDCTRCERSVPVPGFPAMPGESGCAGVYPPEILSMDVVFLCRGCDTKLVVDGRLEGREFDCPQCQTRVKTPVWSRRAKASKTAGAPRKRRPNLTPDEIGFLSGDFNNSPA